MIVKPKYNQSLFDLAIQYTGSAETVFLILSANDGLELTDQLTTGQEIEVPEEAVAAGNQIVIDYYAANNIFPATAIRDESSENGVSVLTDGDGDIVDGDGGIFG
jgi:hypothetical protein